MPRLWTRTEDDIKRRRELAAPVLAALRCGWKLRAALRRARISRTTLLRWRADDSILAHRFDTAMETSRRIRYREGIA